MLFVITNNGVEPQNMKHNIDNRYRSVDPRLLGQLLGSDSPIDCTAQSSVGTCSNRNARGGHMASPPYSNANEQGCGCSLPHKDICDSRAEAHLASACDGHPALSMVYSPYQHYDMLYSANEALARGTLFKELDKPWIAGGMK